MMGAAELEIERLRRKVYVMDQVITNLANVLGTCQPDFVQAQISDLLGNWDDADSEIEDWFKKESEHGSS